MGTDANERDVVKASLNADVRPLIADAPTVHVIPHSRIARNSRKTRTARNNADQASRHTGGLR
jgi:hypothetical protein